MSAPVKLPKSGFQIDKMDFVAKRPVPATPYQNLTESLTELLNDNGIRMTKLIEREIPDSWEKHGDLVLLPANSFSSDLWKEIGKLWVENIQVNTLCSFEPIDSVVDLKKSKIIQVKKKAD